MIPYNPRHPLPHQESSDELPNGWARARSGNPWRQYDLGDRRVTAGVFPHKRLKGAWTWCLHDGEPVYSPHAYPSEAEAIDAARKEIKRRGQQT